MRRIAAAALTVFLLPLAALALDFTDRSPMYADAPFTRSESVGISVLTNLGVVQGYPDRTFRAGQRINRAEFLKIALLTRGRGGTAAQNCFPDVAERDWFSPYVCQAKKDGIVAGYADGFFRPERHVSYAEAVKILAVLYGYPLHEKPGTPWYGKYVDAALERGVLASPPGDLQTFLPRGAMARLAAAFRAEADGELALYRSAEQGRKPGSSSSASFAASSATSSAASSESSPVGASSSSSSMSSASSSLPLFPVRSRFLILGRETPPIAGATYTALNEAMRVRGAEVKLKTKVRSFDALFLIDDAGNKLGQLSLHPNDDTDRTWKGTFPADTAFVIPKGEDRVLGVIARMKVLDAGGVPEELVQADLVRLTVEGVSSGESNTPSGGDIIYPKHQTSLGRVAGVKNAGGDREAFTTGNNLVIGAFAFSADTLPSVEARLQNLAFTISKPAGVAVNGWELGSLDSSTRVSCSVSEATISCAGIPASVGTIAGGSRTLRLFGTVSLDQGVRDPYLQVTLDDPGSVGFNGAVQWSDSTGQFTWVELAAPVAKGTLWK